MATAAPFPGIAAPMPAIARILARFDRKKLEASIEVMLALIDLTDGDADAEDGAAEELSEGGEDDEAADPSSAEWHHRHWRERKAGREPFTDAEDAEHDDNDSCDDADRGEYTDDREPELYEGGHPDIPHRAGTMHLTA